ncbi:MAG: hypothetical protein KF859_07275 [Phycisphaeraceae bacterium]|nr:hypothetical protein [Phycisphaeraceae bacterium]
MKTPDAASKAGMLVRRAAWRGVACALAAACVHGCGVSGEGVPIKPTMMVGEAGLSPGQFSYPRAMDRDGGTVWVIDKTARVQQIDPATGECLRGWRMPDWSVGKPTGITVWRRGETLRVFIADTHYHRIMVYAPEPAAADGRAMRWGEGMRLVGVFGEYGEGDGQMVYPTDVAVLTDGPDGEIVRLYVSEYGGNDRVSIYEPTGEPDGYRFVRSFGRHGREAAEATFSRPQSMHIDVARRELLVADSCNHRIGRFTLDGALIGWVGGPGRGAGEMMYPYGIMALGDGTALVAEFGNSRVQHIDLERGTCLGLYGVPGREAGHLATPWAVTMLGEQAVVLDSGNNRLVGFRLSRGRLWAAGGEGGRR